MNNSEIIEVVEKIVYPYYKFNNEDFYGDRGSSEYPKIEEMNKLFFKLIGRDKNLIITNNEHKKMIDEITNMNVGFVETIRVRSFGKCIVITPYKI